MSKKRSRMATVVLSAMVALSSFQLSSKVDAADGTQYIPVAVPNGGFEEPAAANGAIPGWTTTPAESTFDDMLRASVTTERSYSGGQSLKMIDHDGRSLQVFSAMIPVTGEQTYRLQTQVYVQAKSVRIYLHWKVAGSARLVEGVNVLANTVGSWNLINQEAYAPAGAEYAQVSFYYGASGTGTIAYLDDVRLDRKVVPESKLTLPYAETSIDLGEPVKIGLSQYAVFGTSADGEDELYITTTGSPVGFTVVDPLTGNQKFSERVVGATDTVWGMDRGADNNIYFASTGKLFRYNAAERRIENLGTNPTGNTVMYPVKASADGKIYGGTFHTSNGGRVYEYDIATGAFRDLGVAKAGEAYAIGLGVTERYLYVGTGNNSGLVRYDRTTLVKEELTIPGVTGQAGKTLRDIMPVGGGRLVLSGGDQFHIVNEATMEPIRSISYSTKVSPPNPENPDLLYYKYGEEFFSYNLATDAIERIAIDQPMPDTAFKVSEWVKADTGRFAGKWALYSMAAYGETFVYEPNSGEYEMVYAELAAIGTSVNVLEYNDGHLFMSGFQRGMSVMDTSTDALVYNVPSFHQTEGVGFLGDIAYFGTYPGAKLYRLDLSSPLHYEEFAWSNPGLALDIGDNQNRPYKIASGGGMLFAGTYPSSGFEGALTVLEEVADETGTATGVSHRTYPNLIPNQTVIGLAYHEGSGKLFGSTTVYGYAGSVNPAPPTKEGVVFRFDPATGAVEEAFTPKVPGVTGEVKIVGDLSVGPDGLIWGVQDAFVSTSVGYDASIFAIDPNTFEVVKAKKITQSPYSTSKYRPYYIRWSADGIMYTTIGRKLYAIDPETLEAKQLLPGKLVNNMTLADNGDIYYTDGTKLYKLPVAVQASAPTAEKTTLPAGESTTLSTELRMANGSQRDFSKAVVTYVSDRPDIVSVNGNTATAVAPGTAQVTAMATFEGQQVASEPVAITVAANTAPTVSAIADQEWERGTPAEPIPFTIHDEQTAADALIVTAASDNLALLPNEGVRLGGSGSERTIAVTPAEGQYGEALVTLTVSDGVHAATTAFVVRIVREESSYYPVIGPIEDITLGENAPSTDISFAVSDLDHAADTLTASAVSSNETLIPSGNIVLGGTGESRWIRVAPAANEIGVAAIVVTVSNGKYSSSASFDVAVVPAVAPTVTVIAEQTVKGGKSTGALPFTIGDSRTAAERLQVSAASGDESLIPNEHIVLSGVGAERFVEVTAPRGTTGETVVTLTVVDGDGLATTSSFKVRVSDNNGHNGNHGSGNNGNGGNSGNSGNDK